MMNKHCTLCQGDFPLSDFNKKKSSKDGRQNICRECSRKRARQYYAENREAHKKVVYANKKKYIARARSFLNEIKSRGCAICDEKEVACMDFHHLDPKKKDFLLSRITNGDITSIKRIKKEVQKCACICSNCHRKVHVGLLEVDESHRVVL